MEALMSQPYPNHFLSILRCVFSLKHYSDVHDQPFTRTLLFVVIVALVLTVKRFPSSISPVSRMV